MSEAYKATAEQWDTTTKAAGNVHRNYGTTESAMAAVTLELRSRIEALERHQHGYYHGEASGQWHTSRPSYMIPPTFAETSQPSPPAPSPAAETREHQHHWVVPLRGFVTADSLWWCQTCGAVKQKDEIVLVKLDL